MEISTIRCIIQKTYFCYEDLREKSSCSNLDLAPFLCFVFYAACTEVKLASLSLEIDASDEDIQDKSGCILFNRGLAAFVKFDNNAQLHQRQQERCT